MDRQPASEPPLDVLVIDTDAGFRDTVRELLAGVTGVGLTEHDPVADGFPDGDFSWRDHDVLLLDHALAGAAGGDDWLARLRRRPGFPPTVLATAEADEYVALHALKLGAEDFLRKAALDGAHLHAVLRGAARGAPPRALSTSGVRPPAADDRVAVGINRYALVRKVGAGTQSRIYEAVRKADQQRAAVKIIAASALIDDDAIMRFDREAQALERIRSPYVVRRHEHAFSGDCGYIAMEFLPGGDLRRHLSEAQPLERVRRWIEQVLRGLDTVHGAGVLHRDLKPTNIMRRDDDSLVIADFGIARFAESTGEHTTEGMLLGTPAYMSPEQCMGKPVDERADLYSTGVMLYEMLTGARPYIGRGVTDTLHMHVNEPVPRLPMESRALQPLLDALMAKSLEQRVRKAGDALRILGTLQV